MVAVRILALFHTVISKTSADIYLPRLVKRAITLPIIEDLQRGQIKFIISKALGKT